MLITIKNLLIQQKNYSKNNNIKLIKRFSTQFERKIDDITCIGTATTFPTIDQLLNKIVSLMAPKGLAIAKILTSMIVT